jgi:hypothetical protein
VIQGETELALPTKHEQTLFDALEFCVLPTSAAQLVVAAGNGRVQHLRVRDLDPQFRIQACSPAPDELPWLATAQRLYMLQDGGQRAAALDLKVEPFNVATDLEAIVPAITSRKSGGTQWFFFNTRSGCLVSRLSDSGLDVVAPIDGGVFATAEAPETVLALGGKIAPMDDEQGLPFLFDVQRWQHVPSGDLNLRLHTLARREQGAALPDKYIVERLYCDAFFACSRDAAGVLGFVGGIAEARLPLDLPERSERGPIPRLSDYVGLAWFRLGPAGLQLEAVDIGTRFLASVEAGDRSALYVVQGASTARQSLGDIRVHPDGASRGAHALPLTLSGCSADTPFHKFRVAYRKGCGYLAVANTFWGFTEGRFAPRDLFLTSADGVHWICAGTSDE